MIIIEYLSGNILNREAQEHVNSVKFINVIKNDLAFLKSSNTPKNEQVFRGGRVRPGYMLVFELEPVQFPRESPDTRLALAYRSYLAAC